MISEARFRTLTPLQWLYHYEEVMLFERERQEGRRELTRAAVKVIVDEMFTNTEFLAAFTNNQMYQQYAMEKKVQIARTELSPDAFPETWEEIKAQIPKELQIVENETAQPDLLPKVDRKRFLQFDS